MLNSATIEVIEMVDSVKQFNSLLSRFELSDANPELKEEAIRELKARKAIFYINPVITPKSVFEDIRAGAADIDDIGN